MDVIWKKTNKRYHFTLLEIVICVAILGIAAITLSWQMKDMLKVHHFNNNVDHLVTDLKKCQLIALSDRVDIEMRIEKKGDTYLYTLHCDDPIPCFMKRPMKLNGVQKMKVGKKPLNRHVLTIYSSGRIAPINEIELMQDEERGMALQLEKSPLIEIKRID